MKILCRLFGHKVTAPRVNDSIDPGTGEKGFTKYCDRCSYSEFKGMDVYDKDTVIKNIIYKLMRIEKLAVDHIPELKIKSVEQDMDLIHHMLKSL